MGSIIGTVQVALHFELGTKWVFFDLELFPHILLCCMNFLAFFSNPFLGSDARQKHSQLGVSYDSLAYWAGKSTRISTRINNNSIENTTENIQSKTKH